MKPMLKPPGTKRLKPKYDEPPSKNAFKISLCRYIKDRDTLERPHDSLYVAKREAGAYTRPLFGST